MFQDHSSQKKNPLPPLKVPANRLQTGNHAEQVENKTVEKPENVDQVTDKATDQDEISDTKTSVKEENKTSPVDTDTLDNIEQLEIPEKLMDDIPKDNLQEESSQNIDNNNEEKLASTNTFEDILEEISPKKNLQSTDPSMSLIENEKIEEISDEITKAEIRIEKPISPPCMEPPPKPPRQKSGSGSDSSTNPSSPIQKVDANIIEEIREKMENELKEDSYSIHSIDTQKTRSAKSERSKDEEIHKGNVNESDEDKKEENGKQERKVGDVEFNDDADDVQSPVSKTGENKINY